MIFAEVNRIMPFPRPAAPLPTLNRGLPKAITFVVFGLDSDRLKGWPVAGARACDCLPSNPE